MRIFLAVMMVAASTGLAVADESTTAPAVLQAPAAQSEALQSPALDTAIEQSYSGYSGDCHHRSTREPSTAELLMN